MKVTACLFQHACRITLFTRPRCSLCNDAKLVLSKVWDRKPFDYAEVNVMAPGHSIWKDLYEFDTPVIHFHQASAQPTPSDSKLMHRVKAEDVEKLLEELNEKADA